ncbi:tetratricopeptide repeat protein [Sphingobacterium spiritivorum]|uniref:tetratricopeptide repeat protein n=1 Tax=Sphingobacterium spiritivorum TaxID=258 RepID=UPI003DA39B42
MMKKVLIALLIFTSFSLTVVAQSNIKEGNNSFALYTKTGDIKNLDNARKFADAAFANKRDSSQVKNNILRALVYSSYAVTDSLRKQKYPSDPIDIAQASLKLIDKKGGNDEFRTEISYVKQNLISALIFKANKALNDKKYKEAYTYYERVDELSADNAAVASNLAVLAVQNKNYAKAAELYEGIIQSEKVTPNDYLQLANVYTIQDKKQATLDVLSQGRQQFPKSKEILFELIQVYSNNKSYDAIVPVIDEALSYEPENIEMNYLAGYANESINNIAKAKEYYEKVIRLDKNNYEANLALGLIYLKDFLANKDNNEAQYNAQNYLLKANEIKPYAINALKSLALYYEAADDMTQLDRVNLLLNQLTNN